jgi:hypothetical protein
MILYLNTEVCLNSGCRKLGTSKRFSELEKSKISELLASKLDELRGQQADELAEAKRTVETLTKENQVKLAITDAMYSELTQFVKSKLNRASVLLINFNVKKSKGQKN